MEGPSKPKPEILFNFTITPLTKFRDAIEALVDQDFNPTTDGVIEVFEGGVDFSARNVNTEVTGLLRLNSAALKDFHFDSRCKEKLMTVNFRRILLNISNFHESITFFQYDGYNEVIVSLGKNYPIIEFNLNILTIDPEIERFPDIEYIYEAEFPSDSLRAMLHQHELRRNDKRFQKVVVDISEKFVAVLVGDNRWPWIYDFDEVIKVGVRSKMAPGKSHQARFNWVHLEVMKKASHIGPNCLISFVIRPKNMIMTRFNLGDLGDLVFFDKATIRI